MLDVHAELAPIRQPEILKQLPAVGDRVAAHPTVTDRVELEQLGHRLTGLCEQLLRPVRL